MTTKQVYRAALLGIGALAMATVAVAAEGRVGVYRAAQSLWPATKVPESCNAWRCGTHRGDAGRSRHGRSARLKVGSLDMLGPLCDGTRMPGPALKPLAEYVARGGKSMTPGRPVLRARHLALWRRVPHRRPGRPRGPRPETGDSV